MEIVKNKIFSFVEKLDKFSFNSLKEYANLFELSLKVPYSIKIIYIIFEYTCEGLFTMEHIVHANNDEKYYIQKTLIDYLFADKKKINIKQLIYSEDNWTEDTNSTMCGRRSCTSPGLDSERTNVSDMNSKIAWMGSERTNVTEESNYASDNNSNIACMSLMEESNIDFSNNMEQTEVFEKNSFGLLRLASPESNPGDARLRLPHMVDLHLQSPKSDLSMDDEIIFPYLLDQEEQVLGFCVPPNSPNVTDWGFNNFLNINFQELEVDNNKSISDYHIPSLDSIYQMKI